MCDAGQHALVVAGSVKSYVSGLMLALELDEWPHRDIARSSLPSNSGQRY